MKFVPIKTLMTEKISGEWGTEAAEGTGVYVIRTANFLNTGKIDFNRLVRRTIAPNKVLKKKLKTGDIIVEKSGGGPTQPVGRVVYFQSPDSDTYLCNNFAAILRPNTAIVYPKYFFYALHDNHKRGSTLRFQNKTTGIINLKLNEYLESEIPLPPLEDQIRIAHLLSKVEGLIAQRKQHLQQLDDLLKSVFLNMFGDPVRNEKGWDTLPFSKLLTAIESGSSPKCEPRRAMETEWGVLKLGAVTSCYYQEGENKTLPPTIEPDKNNEVRAGDVLFSRKNTYELVAACAYVFRTRERLLLPDLIFRLAIKPDVPLNHIYLWQLLLCPSQRRKIQSLASGAAGSMPNISKANLMKVSIPCPPLSLQTDFAKIVLQIQKLKEHLQDEQCGIGNFRSVLCQQAFKGELDLSRVVLENGSNTPLANHTIEPTNNPVGNGLEVLESKVGFRKYYK